METEENAKAYDEALEKAKELLNSPRTCFDIEQLKEIFPSLRKSEDERIRKNLMRMVQNVRNYSTKEGYYDIPFDKYLAYLEKQKEKSEKPIIPERENEVMKAIEGAIRVYGKTQGEWLAGYDMDTLVVHLRKAFAALEKQKEQKPLETCNADCKNCPCFNAGVAFQKAEQKPADLPPGFYYIDLDGNKYYSKEFRYGDMKVKVGEQKPAEWSEDDEEMLEYIIGDVNDAKQLYTSQEAKDMADKEIAWLKSLRPSWKPSEEQMEALNAMNCCGELSYQGQQQLLIDLYQQLKKLTQK